MSRAEAYLKRCNILGECEDGCSASHLEDEFNAGWNAHKAAMEALAERLILDGVDQNLADKPKAAEGLATIAAHVRWALEEVERG